MFGRSIKDYNKDFSRSEKPKDQVPELFHPITLEQALETKVELFRVKKTLGWIARNRPLALENLMGSTEPGTVEFSAICLVYEEFEKRIKAVVGLRNEDLQVSTVKGIQESHSRKFKSKRQPLRQNVLFRKTRQAQAC